MARKPESALPVLPSAKPEPPHVQCAADSACRFAGRMWFDGYDKDARICVEHYYRALDKKRGVAA